MHDLRLGIGRKTARLTLSQRFSFGNERKLKTIRNGIKPFLFPNTFRSATPSGVWNRCLKWATIFIRPSRGGIVALLSVQCRDDRTEAHLLVEFGFVPPLRRGLFHPRALKGIAELMQRRAFVLYRGPRVFPVGDGVLRHSTWQCQTGRWSRQHQVERGCLRRPVDLRVIREGQGLDILIPVPLMLLDVMLEALYRSRVEPFGCPFVWG